MENQARRPSDADNPAIGSPFGSGIRDSRARASSTPPSGVRAAQERMPSIPPAPPTERNPPGYTPPRPAFDSESSLTRVGIPDASLLRMARGEDPRPWGTRIRWFLLGVFVGVTALWIATSDAPADVYRARLWVANQLRGLRGRTLDYATSPPASSSVADPGSIPTVDVTDLPRAVVPPLAPPVSPAPSSPPTAPGAPTLDHAPGPR
jgi:hypothetical protein